MRGRGGREGRRGAGGRREEEEGGKGERRESEGVSLTVAMATHTAHPLTSGSATQVFADSHHTLHVIAMKAVHLSWGNKSILNPKFLPLFLSPPPFYL